MNYSKTLAILQKCIQTLGNHFTDYHSKSLATNKAFLMELF